MSTVVEEYLKAHAVVYHRDKLKLATARESCNNFIIPGAILKPVKETVFYHKDSLHRLALHVQELLTVATQHALSVYLIVEPSTALERCATLLENQMDIANTLHIINDLTMLPKTTVEWQIQQQGVLWTIASDDVVYQFACTKIIYVDPDVYDAAIVIMTVEEEKRLHMIRIGSPQTNCVTIIGTSKIEHLLEQGADIFTRFVYPIKMVSLVREGPAVPLRLMANLTAHCGQCRVLKYQKYMAGGLCFACQK